MNDHKAGYGIYLRTSILASLMIITIAFILVPQIEVAPYAGRIGPDDITRLDSLHYIPIDKPQPKPINRPQPKPADIADIDDPNASPTIDPTIFAEPTRINIVRNLDIVPYYKVEIQPKPVQTPAPIYPPLAINAGIEGTCIVKAVLDTLGRVVGVEVYKGSGNALLDEVAINACRNYQYTPAFQRDHPVSVWIKVPIKFELKQGT